MANQQNIKPYADYNNSSGITTLYKSDGTQIAMYPRDLFLLGGMQLTFNGVSIATNNNGRVINQTGLKSLSFINNKNNEYFLVQGKNLNLLEKIPTGGKRKTTRKTLTNKKSKKVKSRKMRK